MRRFLREHEGRWLLIATRRRGWNELLRNHVLPEVPGSVEVVWLERPRRDGCPDLFEHRLRVAFAAKVFVEPRRPYLLRVQRDGFRAIELHEELRPLKSLAARSSRARESVRDALARSWASV